MPKQTIDPEKELDSRQYLPRKGTETFQASKTSVLNLLDSRQYLPRKGTETLPFGYYKVVFFSDRYSRQYLPRKGTETLHSANG